ncbi:MAG: hypothetical protein JO223_04265 [Hyphomicrobiales bacterium]|nr:hypothetical protein [Hyphomicrobiales bacterium]
MLKFVASILLGAALASSPLPAFAQTTQLGASAMHHPHAHRPTRSYRSEMRRRGNAHKEQARAGAEHVRQMRMQ